MARPSSTRFVCREDIKQGLILYKHNLQVWQSKALYKVCAKQGKHSQNQYKATYLQGVNSVTRLLSRRLSRVGPHCSNLPIKHEDHISMPML
ncbi:hypothetical protein GOP47_0012368 [Adiantum capillus-veneris]|uniref:Uncharacterized protein n=1 Tax=Adiantum capillus-veneris TaxID=13818 RepID=A0A9D4ZFM0_ADICA|nr:hypothetical protein GOP47_0012368 [Adiantum capillus-veneris]